MNELKQADVFRAWWNRLKDKRARGPISARLDRPAYGLVGDMEPVGEGTSELRVNFGSGYRVYFR